MVEIVRTDRRQQERSRLDAFRQLAGAFGSRAAAVPSGRTRAARKRPPSGRMPA
jgi:hypothetical protein